MAILDPGWTHQPVEIANANEGVFTPLFASPEDANGRGIELQLKNGDTVLNTTGYSVYLAWHNLTSGGEGLEPFSSVNVSSGKWRVTYPAELQSAAGTVEAKVLLYSGGRNIASSRLFKIHVEKAVIDDDAARSDNNFSAFVQATLDLHTLEESMTQAFGEWAQAENARVDAERARSYSESLRVIAEEDRDRAYYDLVDSVNTTVVSAVNEATEAIEANVDAKVNTGYSRMQKLLDDTLSFVEDGDGVAAIDAITARTED